MKPRTIILSGLVVCCLLASLAACHRSDSAPWAAKALAVAGDARYTVDRGGNWIRLEQGTILPEGCIVQTAQGPENHVDILLGDGVGAKMGSPRRPAADRDSIRIHGDSALAIDRRGPSARPASAGKIQPTETDLDFRYGRITGWVKEANSETLYEVRYADGIVGLRDSDIAYELVRANPLVPGATNPPCLIRILSGAALVARASGELGKAPLAAGSVYDDSTGAVSPLPDAVRGEISATLNTLRSER